MTQSPHPPRPGHQDPWSLITALCRRHAARRVEEFRPESLASDDFRRQFLDLAGRHRVQGLVLSVLSESGTLDRLPRPVCALLLDRLRALRRKAGILQLERHRVIEVLTRAGTDPVILKGGALTETHYRDPTERELQDLDVLIEPERLDRALEALLAAGYSQAFGREVVEYYRRHHFHVILHNNFGHVVELHWALARTDSSFDLPASAFRDHVVRLERGTSAPLAVPPAELMLLHTVQQNIEDGFVWLFRLVDLDRVIASSPDLDWQRVQEIGRRGQLLGGLALSLQLARRILGTDLPEETLRSLLPTKTARFHLALLRPESAVRNQLSTLRPAAYRLLSLWLLPYTGSRLSKLAGGIARTNGHAPPERTRTGMPRPLVAVRDRCRSLVAAGKLILYQAWLYFRMAFVFTTRRGRRQIRFWSTQADRSSTP